MKIDYSNIVETPSTPKSSWRPPRHVFFGKRNPEDGTMEEEPVYKHQEYPLMLYRTEGDVIRPIVVNSDVDRDKALAGGYVRNPAQLGHPTAPSFQELQDMKADAERKAAEEVAAKAEAARRAGLTQEERDAEDAAKAEAGKRGKKEQKAA